jgi:hypothetical protein
VTGVIVSNRINNSTFPGAETDDLSGVVWPPSWTERVARLRVPMKDVPVERIQGLARVSRQEIAQALQPATPAGHPLRMLIQTVSLTETTERIAAAAWRELEPRLLMVYFEGTDGIGRLFAPMSRRRSPAPSRRWWTLRADTRGGYAWIDRLLGGSPPCSHPRTRSSQCAGSGFRW